MSSSSLSADSFQIRVRAGGERQDRTFRVSCLYGKDVLAVSRRRARGFMEIAGANYQVARGGNAAKPILFETAGRESAASDIGQPVDYRKRGLKARGNTRVHCEGTQEKRGQGARRGYEP